MLKLNKVYINYLQHLFKFKPERASFVKLADDAVFSAVKYEYLLNYRKTKTAAAGISAVIAAGTVVPVPYGCKVFCVYSLTKVGNFAAYIVVLLR